MMVGGFQKWLKVRRSKKKFWFFYSEGILTFGGAQLNHQKGSESQKERFSKTRFLTQRDEFPLVNLYRKVWQK